MKKLLFLMCFLLVGCATIDITTSETKPQSSDTTSNSTTTTTNSSGSTSTATDTTTGTITNTTTTITTTNTVTGTITTVTTITDITTGTTTSVTTITTATEIKDLNDFYSEIDTIIVENSLECKAKIDHLMTYFKSLNKETIENINLEKINKLFKLHNDYNALLAINASELFFSEYYEGLGNNKYFEIFNGTGKDVELNGYTVELYTNGSLTAGNDRKFVFTNEKLANNEIFTIADPGSNANIKSVANVLSTVCYYNGDDALVLKKNGVIIDIIGEIGKRTGSGYLVGEDSLKDNTIIRNKEVTKGNSVFNQSEWTSTGTPSELDLNKHSFLSKSDAVFSEYIVFENKINYGLKIDLDQNMFFADSNDSYITIKKYEILNGFDVNKIGVQIMVFLAYDNYGNIYFVTEEFNVVDEIAPIITVKEDAATRYLLNTEVDIKSLLNITDNLDKVINYEELLIEGTIDITKIGFYLITVMYADESGNIGVLEFTIEIHDGSAKKPVLKDQAPFAEAFPSLGTPKLLVIPIGFSGYDKSSTLLGQITIAFNGTSEQTGFESLNSYYFKSSFGKFDVKTVVTDWYTPKFSKATYENMPNLGGSDALLKEACESLDSVINFKDYDYDKDGCIDSIFLIYNCPVSFEQGNELWWAFQYYNMDGVVHDGVEIYYYAFAGTDFLSENLGSALKVNAHTFIHEFGHLMGLDDLYDYNDSKGPNGGFGGADIMDYTIGDHNAYTKIVLGWITPTIISTTTTIDLKSYQNSGEVLLIKKNFDKVFDEYFLVEFYTPDGLNRLDMPMGNESGVKIIHVDARFYYNAKGEHDLNDLAGDAYSSFYVSDNSDTKGKFLEIMEADTTTNTMDIRKNLPADTNDLYKSSTNIFGLTRYSDFKNNQNQGIDFTLVVNSINANISSNITVTFK